MTNIIIVFLVLLASCAEYESADARNLRSGITIEIGADEDYVEYAPIAIDTVQLRIRPDKYGWENSLTLADEKIRKLKLLNYKFVVSVDGFPENADYNQASPKFWSNQRDVDEVVRFASEISLRYANEDSVIAYQFMSEPVNLDGGAHYPPEMDKLNLDIIDAIRENSTRVKVIVAQDVWGFCSNQKVIDRKAIVYGCHYYSPHFMTHQGVNGRPLGVHWPTKYNNKIWDKSKLVATLRETRDFQINNHVEIFIGEYSCIRWGPDCNLYLLELTSIFDEYSWTHMYFQLNGWNGWNPSYSHILTSTPQNDIVGYSSERWRVLSTIYKARTL